MGLVEIFVGLVAACVVLALGARGANIPPAVALVFGGMALALVPDVPRLEFDPHLALALFLPPLLQVSAFRTDWDAFRLELRPILLLALGAVLFTAATVAATLHWLQPSLGWAACIALGAIVAPPDAVAAAAVLKTIHIPRRLMTILEGESLLNDASSLILYRFAVAAAGTTAAVSLTEAGGAFVLSAVGGTAVGWAVGRIIIAATRALADTLLEIAAMVLSGFVAYMAAEAFHLSGVLAAVSCGLVFGRGQHLALSARTRVESSAVWNFIEFLLTSLIFILIGLQLRDVVERLTVGWLELAAVTAAVSAALILSRFAWVFGSSFAARLLPSRFRLRHAAMPVPHLVVISWAGMRGVVSLAAALALPIGFPGRDLIVFLAFCSILVTLVLQGTTLGWLIRKLKVVAVSEHRAADDEARVRRAGAEAALAAVERRLFNGRVLGQPDGDMLREFRRRAETARMLERHQVLTARRNEARLLLEIEAVQVARGAVLAHAGNMDGEALQSIIEEMDFEEGRLNRALRHPHG